MPKKDFETVLTFTIDICEGIIDAIDRFLEKHEKGGKVTRVHLGELVQAIGNGKRKLIDVSQALPYQYGLLDKHSKRKLRSQLSFMKRLFSRDHHIREVVSHIKGRVEKRAVAALRACEDMVEGPNSAQHHLVLQELQKHLQELKGRCQTLLQHI